MSQFSYVLVTGATGFIGAHVLDDVLARGIKARVAVRSQAKGDALRQARPRYADRLDVVLIEDFKHASSSLDKAVEGVDGIIHVASPFTYAIKDNEQDLVLPAINGVKSLLASAAKSNTVKRIVLTSSVAAVVNFTRKAPPRWKYTAKDWNPQTYQESIDKESTAVVAYRGSKKFAELAAWDFVKESKPGFDLVTLCPPMTFGPPNHPVEDISQLNESNATLWQVAMGKDLPVARVPFWVDGRDLARAHVEALLRPEAGNKRYTVAAPERFSYQLAAGIIEKHFDWAKDKVHHPEVNQQIDDSHDLDGHRAAEELGISYRSFEESVVDTINQALKIRRSSSA
jgi:nucleoside-diphosphate-sugar epimerase